MAALAGPFLSPGILRFAICLISSKSKDTRPRRTERTVASPQGRASASGHLSVSTCPASQNWEIPVRSGHRSPVSSSGSSSHPNSNFIAFPAQLSFFSFCLPSAASPRAYRPRDAVKKQKPNFSFLRDFTCVKKKSLSENHAVFYHVKIFLRWVIFA